VQSDRELAIGNLERIRALMDRAGRWSNLSGYSCLLAGFLALAGSFVSWLLRVHFNDAAHVRPLGAVWGAVLVLAVAQFLLFTIANAHRRGEPSGSPLTQRVVAAMLPSMSVAAIFSAWGLQTGRVDLLPPLRMLAHGSSLLAVGIFAGWKLNVAGILFLALGALSLFGCEEYGLRMMAASFGGVPFLLGALILWKSRE
jgi:hypothetical protein